jgi:hypothetical protein
VSLIKKSQAIAALHLALRPLVRILLRSGVTWKDAAETLKITYVEIAMKDYGIHGRPTNASRVAIMTGLTRREGGRIRHLIIGNGELEPLEKMNNATRVLTGWHLNPLYQTASGKPKQIAFTGPAPSFTSLVHQYASDIAPITMLRELMRVDAVSETKSDKLRITRRYYLSSPLDEEAVLRAGSVIADLGNTVRNNLARETGRDISRFEGRATNISVKAVDAKKFRAYIEREGQEFLERIDTWLSEHEQPPDSKRKNRTVRMGVGIYQIDDSH